ncbi:unnamed protein product [Rodentolepis nana]|uniref:U6 snRNA phosphodiesterase 1 n=1 Tax=Rodentolepis nana TaxID=102285 RepID=A0A0R3TDY9_RODNA|nr:unnamed protein product [Rodentolepis nana]
MALIDYPSSESEEEFQERLSPVLPSFSLDIEGDRVRFLETDRNFNPDGRVRGFSHQHGNWSTSLYIPATESLTCFLHTLLESVNSILSPDKKEFHTCGDFHLSLSRTWPILHHWITGFENAVRDIVFKYPRPLIRLDKAEFLVNDEGTRSFLVVCAEKSDLLLNLLGDIDPIVVSYRGEPYYQDQIFHFSLSWCLGDVNNTVSANWKKTCLWTQDGKSK